MTFAPVKVLTYPISMTKASCVALAVLMLASGPALAAGEYAPACGGLKPSGGYPTFCSIPTTPTDVRAPAEFKDAVVGARRAGRRLVRLNATAPISLIAGDTERFAAAAKAYAAPPPPESAPGLEDTKAFEAEARQRAIVPAKPR
jgi:hypothetical protein